MVKLLDYNEVAEMINVKPAAVKKFVYRGLIPTVRFSGKTWRIPQDKLEAVIEQGGLWRATEKNSRKKQTTK